MNFRMRLPVSPRGLTFLWKRIGVAAYGQLVASAALMLMMTSSVFADDLEWTNPATDGTLVFNTATNWNPNDTPLFDDNLLFQLDNNGALILMNAGAQSGDFTVVANRWVFSGLTGGDLTTAGVGLVDDAFATSLASGAQLEIIDGLTWVLSDPRPSGSDIPDDNNLIVGDIGYGSLLVSSGSAVSAEQIRVGNQFGGVGEATITGAGTTITATRLNNSGIFTIGNAGGTGTMNIFDDAQMLTTSTGGNDIWVGSGLFDADPADPLNPVVSSVGTLNVDGVGSFVETDDLNIGIFGGIGFLNVTNGATIVLTDTTGDDVNFGANDNADGTKSSGTGVIDGDGTLVRARTIRIGDSGTGRLEVRNGGEARTLTAGSNIGDAFIGNGTGSDGIAAVYGVATDGTTASRFDVDESLTVGNLGLGQLNIGRDIDDNQVSTGFLQVDVDLMIGAGVGNNLDNRVVVSGVNAAANIGGDLDVGRNGKGTFEALGGSTITVGGEVTVGLLGGANGTMLIDGSGTTLQANNLFTGNGTGSGSTGEVTVSGGAVATFTGGYTDQINAAVNAITLGDDDEGVGTLTVTGAGSLVQTTNSTGGWFIGGSGNENEGTGTANILNGGRGISTSRVWIAHGNNSIGNLNIDGVGSQFDANGDYILIGYEGTGNVDITGGGTLNANRIFVADAVGSNGSQLNVSGAGSTANIDGLLYVGDSNRGTVNVNSGGRLNVATDNLTDRFIIGDEAGSDGSRVTVSDPGSRVDYFGTDRVSVGGINGGGSVANPAVLEVLNGGVFQTEHAGVNTSIGLYVADESNSAGLVTVDGNGSLLRTRLMNVSDSIGTRGTVNVTGGGQIDVVEFVEIGSFGDGDGFLTVAGVGSRLDVGGDLSVAFGQSTLRVDGTLTVIDGGAVANGDQGFIGRASTNVGTVNVGGSGALATWDVTTDLFIAGNESLAVGGSQTSGSGTLNVNANGRVSVGGTLVLKDRGTINLDGGELAAGDFLFQDFSQRTGVPTVNFNSGSLAYTDPAGKTLATSDLSIIFGGGAQVLTAGKRLSVAGLTVLAQAPVDAPLLRINGGTLSVGAISKADFAKVDFDAGTFELTDSNLIVNSAGLFGSTMVLDNQQTVNIVDGTTNVAAGASLNVIGGGFSTASAMNDGIVIVSQTNAVDFDADNSGDGLVNNGRLILVDATADGIVSGPGEIQVIGASGVGGLSMSAPSSIEFLLSETDASQFDSLQIDGSADLAGTLVVELASTFTPAAGDSFALLTTASGLSGMFDTLNLPSLSAGLTWNLNYGPQNASLSVLSGSVRGDFNADGTFDCADVDALVGEIAGGLNSVGFDLNADGLVNTSDLSDWLAIAGSENLPTGNSYLPGDANLDGTVDGQDFLQWNSNKFTATPAWCAGDFTADGNVDGQDFLVWNSQKFNSADGLSAVPEPGYTLLPGFALLLGFFRNLQRTGKNRIAF